MTNDKLPMPNPFPGMNPYLEQADYWSDFHNQLIASLARTLIPKLLPKYRVVTDKWVYKIAGSSAIAIGRPDLTVQQRRTQTSPISAITTRSQSTVQPIRANTRPLADLYPFNLRDRIPNFSLPLRHEDSEPVVDLQTLINELYEQLGYDYFIDYSNSPRHLGLSLM